MSKNSSLNLQEIELEKGTDEIEELITDESDFDIPYETPSREDNRNDLFARNIVFCSALIASLGGCLFGYDIGVISGALEPMSAHFGLGTWEQSLVVSSLLVGATLGSAFGGFAIDFFGRKISIFLLSICFICGSMILFLAPSLVFLIIGRFIIGITVAISGMADCVLISELSPSESRGSLVSLNELSITIGILLAFLSKFVFLKVDNGWRLMFLCPAFLALFQGICSLFLPYSPRWLMLKGKEEEALNGLYSLRKNRDNQEIQEEFNEIKMSIEVDNAISILELLRKEKTLKYRIFVGLLLVTFQQLSGMAAVLYFTFDIFKQSGVEQSPENESKVIVLIGFLKFLTTGLALFLVDRVGRRPLILTGSTLLALGSFVLASGLIYKEYFEDSSFPDSPQKIQFLIFTASIAIFVFGYAIGYGPITWLILSEIFPVGIRGHCFAIASTLNWSLSFILSFAFLPLSDKIGLGFMFLIFGIFNSLGTLALFLFIPETNRMSLEEISRVLQHPQPITRSFSPLMLLFHVHAWILDRFKKSNSDIEYVPLTNYEEDRFTDR